MAYLVNSSFTSEDARRVAYQELDEEWDNLDEWERPANEQVVSDPAKQEPQRSEKNATGIAGLILSALRLNRRDTAPQAVVTASDHGAAGVTVDHLEEILLWTDTWLTAKVFTAGLYLLICVQQIASGALPLQLSTIVAIACLGCLGYNLPSQVMRVMRQGGEVSSPKQAAACQAEAALQVELRAAISRGLERLAPFFAAVIGLVIRRLSGRDHLGTSVWLAIALWLVICLGELQIVSPSTVLVWCWLALFSVPWLYVQCKKPLDSLVEEALQVVGFLLASGNRKTVLLAFGCGAMAFFVCSGMPLYFSIPLSLATTGGVLAWRVSYSNTQ